MYIIEKKQDLDILNQQCLINQSFLKIVNQQFQYIYHQAGDGVSIDEFSLSEIGPIVLLDTGDNLKDLPTIGFDIKNGGLLEAIPEWITTHEINENVVYEINIACNNSYCLTMYLPESAVNTEARKWLNNNM